MAGRFQRKRKRSVSDSSSGSEEEGSYRSPTPMKEPSKVSSLELPKLDNPNKLRYEFYNLSFYDLTKVYFFTDVYIFKKVHLSICKYMNSSFKLDIIVLDFFVSRYVRRKIFDLIIRLRCFLSSISLEVKIELQRFWKVKRVQIAKSLLDCVDNKLDYFNCAREIEKIIYNGLCYAGCKEMHSDNLYNFCMFIKLMYATAFQDYIN